MSTVEFGLGIEEIVRGGSLRGKYENDILEIREKRPNEFMCKLLEVMCTGREIEKKFCCLLIRQGVSCENPEKNLWDRLEDSVKEVVKEKLVEVAVSGGSWQEMKDACDCIVELFVFLVTRGEEWEGFIEFIWRCLDGDWLEKRVCLNILGEICAFVSGEMMGNREMILKTCWEGLCRVELGYYGAVIGFICKYLAILGGEEIGEFCRVLALSLETVVRVMDKSRKDAEEMVKRLRELAENNPEAYKGCVEFVVQMIRAISLNGLDNLDVLNICFELLNCLCPVLYDELVKNHDLIHILFLEIFKFMNKTSELIDDDWLNPQPAYGEAENNSIEIDYAKLGAKHISSIIQFTGEDSTIPSLLFLIKSELHPNPIDWRTNYSCLLILSELSQYTEDPSDLSPLILQFPLLSQSPNPKQISSLLHCICQFSLDFSEKFTETFHTCIFPLLINLLSDPIPHICAETIKAIQYFCENSALSLISEYFSLFFPKIVMLIESENDCVVMNGLAALSSFAEVLGDLLKPWYAEIAGKVIGVVWKEGGLDRVRGKALETAAVFCVKVGSEWRDEHSKRLMEMIGKLQESWVEENEPLRAFVLSAWQILAPAMGVNFSKCIKDVLPGIFSVLKIDPIPIQTNTNSILYTENYLKPINSEEFQIKVLALEALSIISKNLEANFSPYVKITSEAIIPYLEFPQNTNLRQRSAEILPILINALKLSGNESAETGKEFLGKIWNSLSREYDTKVKSVQLNAIHSIIDTIGIPFMNKEEFEVSSKNLFNVLDFYYKDIKSQARVQEPSTISVSEEVDELYSAVSELLGSLFRTHKHFCRDLLRDVCVNILAVYLNPDEPTSLHKLAIYIIDDIIEHLGPEIAADSWNRLAEALFIYALDKDDSLRQGALYGLGLLAQFSSNEQFLPWKERVLDVLPKAIHIQPVKNTKSFVFAKENGVSALGKIIKYQGSIFEFNFIIPAFVNLMPLRNDVVEGKIMHELLADLCCGYPRIVFGEDFERGEFLLRVFCMVVESKLCKKKTVGKIQKVFACMWELWQDRFQIILHSLDDYHQKKIKSLMNI